jgi:hypothetical protein
MGIAASRFPILFFSYFPFSVQEIKNLDSRVDAVLSIQLDRCCENDSLFPLRLTLHDALALRWGAWYCLQRSRRAGRSKQEVGFDE